MINVAKSIYPRKHFGFESFLAFVNKPEMMSLGYSGDFSIKISLLGAPSKSCVQMCKNINMIMIIIKAERMSPDSVGGCHKVSS